MNNLLTKSDVIWRNFESEMTKLLRMPREGVRVDALLGVLNSKQFVINVIFLVHLLNCTKNLSPELSAHIISAVQPFL